MSILYLFALENGTLHNEDDTIIINEASDIKTISNYTMIIISGAEYSYMSIQDAFKFYRIYYYLAKEDIEKELHKNYYCKYNLEMRIFTKENIDFYFYNHSHKKITSIYKFNDYNEDRIFIDEEAPKFIMIEETKEDTINKQQKDKIEQKKVIKQNIKKTIIYKYNDIKLSIPEFITQIKDSKNILISKHTRRYAYYKEIITMQENKLYINFDDIFNKLKPYQIECELEDFDNFNEISKYLELQIIPNNLQIKNIIGMDSEGNIKYLDRLSVYLPKYYYISNKNNNFEI